MKIIRLSVTAGFLAASLGLASAAIALPRAPTEPGSDLVSQVTLKRDAKKDDEKLAHEHKDKKPKKKLVKHHPKKHHAKKAVHKDAPKKPLKKVVKKHPAHKHEPKKDPNKA